jgi:predicted ArsR family transcriptional regulator
VKKQAEGNETRAMADAAIGASVVPGAGGPAETGSAPGVQDEQPGTRHKVARSILDHGPSTAAELAQRLELTPAAVRRHLDSLVGDGVVEPRAKRVYGARGRGRPAKVFALTDCGRDAFDQGYDQLAAEALRWIAQSAGGGESGEAAVAEFARARVATQAERYHRALRDVPPQERAKALAEALTEDGYAATARGAPASSAGDSSGRSSGGEQLCQHHCPVAHTAEQFPQLCEAETEFFSRLLGTHVQRLATIAHGDGVCTTFIPHIPDAETSQPQPKSQTRTSGTERPPQSTRTTGNTSQATTTSANAAPAHIAGRNPA